MSVQSIPMKNSVTKKFFGHTEDSATTLYIQANICSTIDPEQECKRILAMVHFALFDPIRNHLDGFNKVVVCVNKCDYDDDVGFFTPRPFEKLEWEKFKSEMDHYKQTQEDWKEITMVAFDDVVAAKGHPPRPNEFVLIDNNALVKQFMEENKMDLSSYRVQMTEFAFNAFILNFEWEVYGNWRIGQYVAKLLKSARQFGNFNVLLDVEVTVNGRLDSIKRMLDIPKDWFHHQLKNYFGHATLQTRRYIANAPPNEKGLVIVLVD
jgi:hypothetical protein